MAATLEISRPDLAAHEFAMRAQVETVVGELRRLLGARLVAYLASVQETRAVHEWAEGKRQPREATERRLRFALQVARTLADAESAEVTQAWFQGLNPQLDDQSPARLLRDGDLDEVGPGITSAARAFLAGGCCAE